MPHLKEDVNSVEEMTGLADNIALPGEGNAAQVERKTIFSECCQSTLRNKLHYVQEEYGKKPQANENQQF